MTLKVLITADPIEKLLVQMDTSIAVAVALLGRGHSVDWCVLEEQDASAQDYLSRLRARSIVEFKNLNGVEYPVFGADKVVDAADYDVVFHRKDPPVDDFFVAHHKRFLDLKDSVLQINHPKVTLKYHEHELPKMFPEYSIPTFTAQSFDEITSFQKLHNKVVLKPDNSCSGIGIQFVFSDSELLSKKASLDIGYPWVLQPFIPNIGTVGDLRVLYFNGKHMGQILRLPAPGSLLANIHQGGSVVKADLSPKQKEASHVVAQKLLPLGAMFIGIDFLGDKISEVNITSPMGLRQLNALYGVESHYDFVKILENI